MENNVIIDLSCRDFVNALATKSPIPGGGGAAALGGAIGMALANMVANLTIGKQKYAEFEAEIIALKEVGLKLQQELLCLVADDEKVFAPLAQAYSLPITTEEEKQYKALRLSELSKDAAIVPLLIAQKTLEGIKIAKRIAEIGSKLAVSDAGCSAMFLQAAANSAELNVLINLSAIQDDRFVENIKFTLSNIKTEAEVLVQETKEIVLFRL